jgi:hypothetical protein
VEQSIAQTRNIRNNTNFGIITTQGNHWTIFVVPEMINRLVKLQLSFVFQKSAPAVSASPRLVSSVQLDPEVKNNRAALEQVS